MKRGCDVEPVSNVRPQAKLEDIGADPPVIITGTVSVTPSSSGQFITCTRKLPTAWPTAAGAGSVTLVNGGGTFLVYYPAFATFAGNLICVNVGGHFIAVGNL